MTPQQAYEWLAPKLCTDERKALDVIFTALPKQVEAAATKWGCHCDLEPGQEPDGCVLDKGRARDCVLAERLIENGQSRDDCAEWRRIEVGPNAPAHPLAEGQSGAAPGSAAGDNGEKT